MKIRVLIDFLSVAAPKVAGGVCTLVLNAALLRFFSSEQFGIYSLCLAGILLADGVLGSAIDMGVLRLVPLYRETDPARSLSIEKAALQVKLVATLAVSVVLVLFAQPLSRIAFQQEGTAHLLYLSCFAAVGMLALRSVLVHLQIEGKFLLYGILDLLHSVLKFGGIALLLLFHQVSPTAVLAFFVIAPCCAFVIGLSTIARKILGGRLARLEPARELLSFVKWSLLTFGLAAFISRLDLLFLAAQSSMHQVGIFSGGQVFALVPELLGTYLAIILSPRIMLYYREGRFFAFFRRFQLLCFVGCLAIYLITIFCIQSVSPVLFPATFVRSRDVFMILFPGALAGLATFPLTISFLMFVRPRFLFTMDCLSLPLIAALYFYAIQRHGAIGAAWVTSGSRFAKAALAQVIAWKWARHAPELAVTGVTPLGMPKPQIY